MTVQLNAVSSARTQAHDAPQRTRKVLVVACPNARSEELFRALRSRAADGETSFNLVVPAIPSGLDWLADMSAGRDEAQQRLRNLLWRARSKGLPVESAVVGAPDAVAAAMDAVNFTDFDEILVASTRPRRAMARIGMSLAARIHRATGLPVEHVVSAPARRPVAALRPEPAAANLDFQPAGPLVLS